MLDNLGHLDLNGFDIQVMLKNNANDLFFQIWGGGHFASTS